MLTKNQVFAKYIVVGGVGTCLHLGVLIILTELLSFNPLLASSLGFILTVIVSYLLNYKWTFSSLNKHSVAFPRYLSVSIMGLCLNTAIMFLSVNILHLWYGLGQLVAVILIPLHNFVLNSYWSFKASK